MYVIGNTGSASGAVATGAVSRSASSGRCTDTVAIAILTVTVSAESFVTRRAGVAGRRPGQHQGTAAVT